MYKKRLVKLPSDVVHQCDSQFEHDKIVYAKQSKGIIRIKGGWRCDWHNPLEHGMYVRDVIPGPFSSPQIAIVSPFIVLCRNKRDKTREYTNDEYHEESKFKTGIPDSWQNYAVLKGLTSGIHDIDPLEFELHLKALNATESIRKQWNVSLSQGIPDPWRNSSKEAVVRKHSSLHKAKCGRCCDSALNRCVKSK